MFQEILPVQGGQAVKLPQFLRQSCGAGGASGSRAGQVAEYVRWLGGYLQAAAILAQIPGGAAYEPLRDEQVDFCAVIWTRDSRDAMALLGEVLARLGVGRLMEQVPGGRERADRNGKVGGLLTEGAALIPGFSSRRRSRVDARLRARLDRLGPRELVHVAVDCLDRIFIAPVSPGWERYNKRSKK